MILFKDLVDKYEFTFEEMSKIQREEGWDNDKELKDNILFFTTPDNEWDVFQYDTKQELIEYIKESCENPEGAWYLEYVIADGVLCDHSIDVRVTLKPIK